MKGERGFMILIGLLLAATLWPMSGAFSSPCWADRYPSYEACIRHNQTPRNDKRLWSAWCYGCNPGWPAAQLNKCVENSKIAWNKDCYDKHKKKAEAKKKPPKQMPKPVRKSPYDCANSYFNDARITDCSTDCRARCARSSTSNACMHWCKGNLYCKCERDKSGKPGNQLEKKAVGLSAEKLPRPEQRPDKPKPPRVTVQWRPAGEQHWRKPPITLPGESAAEVKVSTQPPSATTRFYVVPAGWTRVSPKGGLLGASGSVVLNFTAPDMPGDYLIEWGLNFGEKIGRHDTDLKVTVTPPRYELIDGKGRRWRPLARQPSGTDSLRLHLQRRFALDRGMHGGPLQAIAAHLIRTDAARDALHSLFKDEIDHLLATRAVPDPSAAIARDKALELFSYHWKWHVDVPLKMTASDVGSRMIMEGWERSWEVTDGIAGLADYKPKNFTVGDVLDGVSYAVLAIDLWRGLNNAMTSEGQEEALRKFAMGVGVETANKLLGDLLGAPAGIANWYVQFLLGESYDSLIGKHDKWWADAYTQWAVERDWLGVTRPRSISNIRQYERALKKATRTILSGKNLFHVIEQELLDTQRSGSGIDLWARRGENESTRRMLPNRFARKLALTEEIVVDNDFSDKIVVHPRDFFNEAHKEAVNHLLKKQALVVARGLLSLELAFWSQYEKERYSGHFRLVMGGGSAAPAAPRASTGVSIGAFAGQAADSGSTSANGVAGVRARLAGRGMEDDPIWTTASDGGFVLEATGLDFADRGPLVLAVKTGPNTTSYFVLERDIFKRTTE